MNNKELQKLNTFPMLDLLLTTTQQIPMLLVLINFYHKKMPSSLEMVEELVTIISFLQWVSKKILTRLKASRKLGKTQNTQYLLLKITQHGDPSYISTPDGITTLPTEMPTLLFHHIHLKEKLEHITSLFLVKFGTGSSLTENYPQNILSQL